MCFVLPFGRPIAQYGANRNLLSITCITCVITVISRLKCGELHPGSKIKLICHYNYQAHRKTPMKVLHVGNFKSGIDTYVRNVVACASDEFEFVIVGGLDDESAPFMRHGQEVKSYHVHLFRRLNPINDLRALIETVRIIRREKPDLVHCHSAKGGFIGRYAAWLTRTKSVYTAHAFSFLSAPKGLKRQLFLLFEKIGRLNSTLLACSDSERKLGVEVAGYKPERALTWHNCIPDVAAPGGCSESENGDGYIVSVGRPSYQKNPLLMIEIMRRVHEKHPGVRFLLLGVGFYSPMLESVKSAVAEYGLGDVVEMLPWISHEETMRYIERSHFYLTTSLYEGLPIAVLEAMALGKAIVSSDVIGNNDCISDGQNGFLLPLDADKFAETCCQLLEDADLRAKMGKSSRELFTSEFEIGKRISGLEGIYKRIAKG